MQRGCTLVDTTCGSVLNVWKNVKRYAEDGFTSVIHGKHWHEETRATASQACQAGGHYLVVLDKDEAGRLRLHPGRRRPRGVPRALRRRGLPGLRSRRRSAAHRLRQPDDDAQHRVARRSARCSARDARALRRGGAGRPLPRVRHHLQRDPGPPGCGRRLLLAEQPLDLMVVIGGYNSSNTCNLARICASACRRITSRTPTGWCRRRDPPQAGGRAAGDRTRGWLPPGRSPRPDLGRLDARQPGRDRHPPARCAGQRA